MPPAPRDKAFPVSWDQFHRDARALAWRLASAGPFNAIVAITRGGLVPAAIVARELEVRVIETVSIASYHDYKTQGGLKVLKAIAPEVSSLNEGTKISHCRRSGRHGRHRQGGARDAASSAFCRCLRQAFGAPAGRHFHHRSLPGHLDLFSLGHGPRFPAANRQRQRRLRFIFAAKCETSAPHADVAKPVDARDLKTLLYALRVTFFLEGFPSRKHGLIPRR